MTTASISAEWHGPYGWPKYESDLPPVPALPGVYLQTVEYQNGYLIYAAGITRRSVSKRLREHTRLYTTGVYNVLNIEAMRAGVRTEVWHGFWMKPRLPERVAEYEALKETINDAVRKQLAGFRIFVANIGSQPRLLERLEAAIMNHLYEQPPPFCDIPDKGMMLAPRWSSEHLILVHSRCAYLLHTLPAELAI